MTFQHPERWAANPKCPAHHVWKVCGREVRSHTVTWEWDLMQTPSGCSLRVVNGTEVLRRCPEVACGKRIDRFSQKEGERLL